MNINIFNALAKGDTLIRAFERLNEKAIADPHLLGVERAGSEIDLRWLLSNKWTVISHLKSEIEDKKFFPGPATLTQVSLDKDRDLISMSWPDRLIDSTLATTLTDIIEPKLSSRVYSFRKGRSHQKAVQDAARWIQSSHARRDSPWVLKLDISGYDRTISHSLLQKQLELVLGNQDSYVWELLRAYFAPQLFDHSKVSAHKSGYGLSTGLCLTQVCANIYLMKLDSALESIPGAFYARFGDDVLFLHSDRETVLRAREETLKILSQLELTPSPSKSALFNLNLPSPSLAPDREGHPIPLAPNRVRFDYLGLSLNLKGEIFISRRREKKFKGDLRKIVHLSYSIARREKLSTSETILTLINSLNNSLIGPLQHSYLSDILWNTTDTVALRHLDIWIAKQTLSPLYRTSHDRVFRHVPLKELRNKGLLSLSHLKNVRGRLR